MGIIINAVNTASIGDSSIAIGDNFPHLTKQIQNIHHHTKPIRAPTAANVICNLEAGAAQCAVIAQSREFVDGIVID